MNMAETYQREIEALLCEWKQKPPFQQINHQDNIFIEDGVVCPEQWFSQTVRPLFLLKEARGGTKNWNLIREHLLQDGKIGTGTWKQVSQWSKGLLGTTEHDMVPYCADGLTARFGNPYLRQIAVMNVKKSDGAKNSNMDEINQYAKYDKQQLRREIELIDPTVIVCGYTISSLQIIMEREIKNYRQPNANLYYILELNGHAVIVLDYYHPSNHYPAVMNYYGLLGIYQQALIHIRREGLHTDNV